MPTGGGAGNIAASLGEEAQSGPISTGNISAPVINQNGPGQVSSEFIVGGVLVVVLFIGIIFYVTRKG
jgi:hypothetical protein